MAEAHLDKNCLHCHKVTKHQQYKFAHPVDSAHSGIVDKCLICEMIDYSDDEKLKRMADGR